MECDKNKGTFISVDSGNIDTPLVRCIAADHVYNTDVSCSSIYYLSREN